MGEKYVGTYKGYDIYYLTPPDVSEPVYHSPGIAGHYFKRSAVEKRIDVKVEQDVGDGDMDQHVKDYLEYVAEAQAHAEAIAGTVVEDILQGAETAVDVGIAAVDGGVDYFLTLLWGALDGAVGGTSLIITSEQGDVAGDIDDVVAGLQSWIFDQFDDLGIDLEGALTDLTETVDAALEDMGIDVENIKADTVAAIESGLEGAGSALSTALGTLSAEIGGLLDAVGDLVDPVVEGLSLGFIALIDGFKDLLTFEATDMLDYQDQIQALMVKRQIEAVKKAAEAG